MSVLKPTSTGHDWNQASVQEQNDFCRTTQADEFLGTAVLRDALTILFRTDKKPVCDIPLGHAVELLARSRQKLG